MDCRVLAAAALLFGLAGCGESEPASSEVRLLAPAGLVGDTRPFERQAGCRVDVRIYDEDEDIGAIALRRDADVVARPTRPGEPPHDSTELVRITLDRGLEIVVPKRFAGAYDAQARPAGRRSTRWEIRPEGPNPSCARRWLAYASRNSK